jgi:hypothetical protein
MLKNSKLRLEQVLDILGVSETELPVTKGNKTNLYAHPGKDPTAQLFANGSKFIIRFGDAVLPSAFFERTDEGTMKFTPVKLSLLQRHHHP